MARKCWCPPNYNSLNISKPSMFPDRGLKLNSIKWSTFEAKPFSAEHISAVLQCSFYQLRLMGKLKPYLPYTGFERVIRALKTSRIDYCNSLYAAFDGSLLCCSQLLQNAAARHLTSCLKSYTNIFSRGNWDFVSYPEVIGLVLLPLPNSGMLFL